MTKGEAYTKLRDEYEAAYDRYEATGNVAALEVAHDIAMKLMEREEDRGDNNKADHE